MSRKEDGRDGWKDSLDAARRGQNLPSGSTDFGCRAIAGPAPIRSSATLW